MAEILDHSRVDEWNFVPGIQNPAHIGNRRVKVTELKHCEWFSGAYFLNFENDQRPAKPAFDSTSESKTAVCATARVQTAQQKMSLMMNFLAIKLELF